MRHRVLRLEPGVGVLERRGHLLPRHHPRAARARPPRHLLRARRLRPPAAPRHRRSAVGRGRRLPGDRGRGAPRRSSSARGADVVVKASGVGVFDELLEAAVLDAAAAGTLVVFWDVDAPATLDRVARRSAPIRSAPLIPRYDLVLTYGGGDPVVRRVHGARRARLRADLQRARSRRPTTRCPPTRASRPTSASSATACPTARRASRSSSSAPRRRCPAAAFLLGGSGWDDKPLPAERRATSATSTPRDHNAFNCTPRAVLNVSRDSMARYGFSPATRVFEAAGAGACLITDAWDGHRAVPRAGARGARRATTATRSRAHRRRARRPARARAIGERRAGACSREHTYAHRAARSRRRAPRAMAAPAAHARGRMSAPGIDDRRPRAVDHVVVGQRPRDDLPRRSCASWPRAATTSCSSSATCRGTRRTATCRSRRTAARALREPATSSRALRRRGARRRSRRSSARTCPRASRSATGSRATARGVTAFYDIDTPVTLAALAARRPASTSRRALIPRYSTCTSRSPAGRRCARLERELGAPARAAAVLLGRSRAVLSRRRRQTALGPRLPGHLQRRPPARARAPAARAGARAGRRAASSSPARSTRTTSRWPRERRADRAPVRPASTAPSTPRSASR